jgi:hypothetical protein
VPSTSYAEAISLFERALALDPRSAEAQSWLASALIGRMLDHLTNTKAADIACAEELTGQTLAASPRRRQCLHNRLIACSPRKTSVVSLGT